MSSESEQFRDEEMQRALIDLVDKAIDLPTKEQAAFVRAESKGNALLAQAVLEMLRLTPDADSFLEEPAGEAADLFGSVTAQAELSNQTIGPYQLVRKVGTGGMGNVYLARQRGDGFSRHVAIKVVKRGMDTDAVLARFRLERHILASLNHPGIAKMIDAGSTDDGLAYFVMEFVNGIPITKYADRHNLSIPRRLEIFQDACEAIHYAHQNLVVHRDIKPSNILVTDEGHVKLLDFGIAKVLNADITGVTVPMTAADVQFLTPEYASPEHIRRESISTASDVYSLGVLLYEMLTGHRPFTMNGRSYPDVVRAVCDTEPTRPSDVVGSAGLITQSDGSKQKVSAALLAKKRAMTTPALVKALTGDLDTIILKALRKNPAERYESVVLLRDDVQRYHLGQPILARPSSLGYRVGKFYYRNTALSWTVGLASLLLIVLTVGWITTLSHQRNEAEAALARAESVKDFMVNVIGQGSVGSSTNDKRTKAALLLVRPAIDELSASISDNPGASVAILNVAANLMMMNGATASSDSLLRRAKHIALNNDVPEEDQLETDFQIGLMHHRNARYDSSATVLRPVFERRRELFGETDERTLEAMGWLVYSVGRESDPVLFDRVLSIFEKKFGRNSREVANLLSDIGQGAGTMDYLERSLDIYTQLGDVETNSGAASVMSSISVGIETEEPARALELAKRSLSILENTIGKDHIHTLTTANNLAAMYYDRGMYPLADSLLLDVAERREKLIPGSSLENTTNQYYRGLTRLALEDYDEAYDRLSTALSLMDSTHPMYSAVRRYTTIAMGKQGHIREAHTFLLEDIDRLDLHPETNAKEIDSHRSLLAKLQVALDRDGS